ncbi:MAG TPA: riboflavin synthase [Planctomycetota bacterium]|nr:riboflavin synthase [Planctomycetota bacterium]
MFTGIVARKGRVVRAGRKLVVETGWKDLAHGESVSVAGVCLTVARLDGPTTAFDLVSETLKKTTLGWLRRGDRVNLERALRHGDRLSGHLVQGHVEGTGVVTRTGKTLRVETELASQMIPKGSITVDGVSLTIVDVEPGAFTVALIPTTRRITTLGSVRKGARVNLELDLMTKRPKKKGSTLTREFLLRAGF